MATEQSGSSGSTEVKEEEEDITEEILDRIYKFTENKFSYQITDYIPKLIVALVSITSFLMTYQINATSGYFGSGLKIPSHNVGIYAAKLISYRSFLMMLGFAFVYLINYIFSFVFIKKDIITARKAISLFFLYYLVACRFFLLFSSFFSSGLSYRVYLFLCIEGMASGTFQMSLILLIPQYIYFTFLSIHVLAFIFFLTQFVFDLFLSHKPLLMIRIHFCMSLVVSIIGFGLWAFYLFYYHDNETKYYNDELYQQNDKLHKINSICEKLNALSKRAKEIIKIVCDKLRETSYEEDITNYSNELTSIISEILTLTDVFFTLLKECQNYIDQYKKTIENLYNENKEKPDSDGKKDEKKFHSQKSKYYNDKFSEKVNELNKIIDESYNKTDLKDLSSKITNKQNEIKGILKVFNNGGTNNSFEFIIEIHNIQDKMNKLYKENENTYFDFTKPYSGSFDFNQLSREIKNTDDSLGEKTQSFTKTIVSYEKIISECGKYIKILNNLENDIMKLLFKKSDHIIFCYVMIGLACFFRDFLYPSTIPHALLIEYEAQKILLLGIILQLLFCFPIFILDDLLHIFTLLIEKYFTYFWALAGPPLIVLIFTFLAIHTKIRFFHLITESTGRVFLLSLFLIPFYTLMESVSYAYLSHHVFYHLGFSDHNLLFLLFHQLLEMFCTYFFSKLSVGYNHARVRLGHCLPTYTTNYDMTSCQEFWSMLKWMLQYTFKDILFFFRTNIRQYL